MNVSEKDKRLLNIMTKNIAPAVLDKILMKSHEEEEAYMKGFNKGINVTVDIITEVIEYFESLAEINNVTSKVDKKFLKAMLEELKDRTGE